MVDRAESVAVALRLAVRGGSAASHRDGRGARLARRDDREYGQYLREEQRRPPGCPARRMQRHFRHGLLGSLFGLPDTGELYRRGAREPAVP